jgi:hypothetical protein
MACAAMDENVLQILRLEVEVEMAVEVDAHPCGREQLCPWCGGMMLGVRQTTLPHSSKGDNQLEPTNHWGLCSNHWAYESSSLPTSLHICVYKQGMYL